LVTLLEDSEMAIKVNADIVDTYQRNGLGPAMAKFIQLVRLEGPLPGDYLDRPAPDPAQFGLPTEDDGSRDDLLLSGNLAMPPFEPDAEALRGSSVRIITAIGEAGEGSLARRGGEALAALLGVTPWSSRATTAASPPTSGRRTTTPARSPGSCARRWSEPRGGLPLRGRVLACRWLAAEIAQTQQCA
jgi:hypothetical protein